MEKFIEFFQKNAILKILTSFGLLFLICWLFNLTEWTVFKYLIWLPAVYLTITWVTMVIYLIRIVRNERYDKKHNISGD